MPSLLDSKTGHYISTASHCLSRHHTATERSKCVTSSCSRARAYHNAVMFCVKFTFANFASADGIAKKGGVALGRCASSG